MDTNHGEAPRLRVGDVVRVMQSRDPSIGEGTLAEVTAIGTSLVGVRVGLHVPEPLCWEMGDRYRVEYHARLRDVGIRGRRDHSA
jgi:hypothetical protein